MSTVSLLKIKPIYEQNLETKVEDLRHLDRELKKIEKAYKILKSEIVETMIKNKMNAVVNSYGHTIATYTARKSADGFDKERFNADYPNVYNLYAVQKPDTYAFNLKS